MAQVLVPVAVSAAVSAVAWTHVGNNLSIRTDIVGSTIFKNFDIYHYLDHLYIAVLLFPALAAALYFGITRWGPLALREDVPPWPPILGSDDPPATRDTGSATSIAFAVGVLARMLLPALVIAVEVEIGLSPRSHSLEFSSGAATAVGYVVAVSVLAVIVQRAAGLGRSAWSLANAVLGIAVVPMLLLVSASTAVTVVADQRVVRYPWLPGWLVAAATVLALALVVSALKRQGLAAASHVERKVLVAAAGPVALFLTSALFIGAEAGFAGYDDAQAMAGARLMFSHGLWPWRDIFLLHGFFSDGLYGAVGMWLFGPTRWASDAGQTLLVAPLTLIALYTFVAYFARRNYVLLVAGYFAMVLGLLSPWPGSRYVLMPLVLVLLDRVLRKGSWGRCWAFMGIVVFTSIVAPESTIIVLGVLATLVLADLVHRPRGRPLLEGLRRTVRCAAAGTALTLAWVVVLVANHALSGFIAYYTTTIRGHELWGALPVKWPFPGDPGATVEFAILIVLFMLTVAKLVWKLRHHSPWRPHEWVMVASATTVPVFAQIALDRFDTPHVGEFFQPALPLVLLWVGELVAAVDRLLPRLSGLWRSSSVPLRARWQATPASLATVVIVVLVSPSSLIGTWKAIPARFHSSAPTEPTAAIPLGYVKPDAVDVAQIEDLAAVVNRFAGPSAPVFEFTNELGITYFLLDRVPGARFYHIGAAQTEEAQRLEISDLERSRPPVVIFSDVTFGLPDYDGLWSMERNYLVSQYLLDHYRPVVDVQGQIVMLRNDMVSRAPALPALHAPPVTTGLYFADEPTCDWGYVPNFLIPPTPAETSAEAPATLASAGYVVRAKGWAYDAVARRPASAVVAVRDGVVIGRAAPTIKRPDVASYLRDTAAENSGWYLSIQASTPGGVSYYSLNQDGTMSALHSTSAAPAPPKSVRDEQGGTHLVVQRPGNGGVEDMATSPEVAMAISGGEPLTNYHWLALHAPGGFGNATIRLTDQPAGTDPGHIISFQTLPRVGDTVYVRVGSCIQWHGYTARTLWLSADGAPAGMSVGLLP